jgi:exodeoxyribonuclease-3
MPGLLAAGDLHRHHPRMSTRLRIVSLNLNGIRSASRKGFLDWAAGHGADVIAVQELKAHESDLDDAMRVIPCSLGLDIHTGHFHCAEQKGYSGVGLYARQTPIALRSGIDDAAFDAEGRWLEADFGAYAVVSLYLPSGSSSPERQAAKFRFMALLLPRLQALRASGREVIICGDWNIAHQPIDLRNWKSNQKNSGFLPEERQWLSQLFDELGYVDVFRRLDPNPERYTWWSNRGQAWAKNVGWRLDYQIASAGLAGAARAAHIHKSSRFSDHAPLVMDYDL